MKIAPVLIALCLSAAATAAFAGPRYAVGVDGLACPFCAYGLEKRLGAIAHVEEVAIDLESGRAIVTMADEQTLDEATARKAVKDAGFTLRDFGPVAP